MKQILVVTHGELAFELIKTVEFVLGEKPAVEIKGVSFVPKGGFEMLAGEIKKRLKDCDGKYDAVILTDMFGGTPSNVSLAFLDPGNVEVVTGVNLPMLLKLSTLKTDTPLEKAVNAAKKAGRESIVSASGLLEKEEAKPDSDTGEKR